MASFCISVILNLITLSHTSDTGHVERTVLWCTILWDFYESVYCTATLKIKCSPQAHICLYSGFSSLEIMRSSVSIFLGSSLYILELSARFPCEKQLKAGMHKFSKTVGPSSKCYVPEGWHEESSILSIHKY